MPSTKPTQKSTQLHHSASDKIDEANGITLLLSDHERFGFSERACYHFDLVETLTQAPQELRSAIGTSTSSDQLTTGSLSLEGNEFGESIEKIYKSKEEDPRSNNLFCGVLSLLECIPQVPLRQQKQRKRLLKRIKEFNRKIEEERNRCCDEGLQYCHQPQKLPLRLNFNTRVAFAYDLTRLVFCLDASPTLTSTFGNVGYIDESICAMDRLESMVRTYFKGLIQPITGATFKKKKDVSNQIESKEQPWWQPTISVTVIAVFPKSMTKKDNASFNCLVSDFTVEGSESAAYISDKIIDWATIEIENEIATRLKTMGGKIDSSSSSLRDMIEKCDVALASMPTRGRPVITIATDCRAVECESILDLVRDRHLKDVPLNILDLSGSHSHRSGESNISTNPNYLTFDADGPNAFPLTLPDDSLNLFNACKSTRGYFVDSERLEEAVATAAGDVPASSPFFQDVYFAAKRRVVRPNALQWHTIFSLSPCCSLLHRFWGSMPPPTYIQKRQTMVTKQVSGGKTNFFSYFLNPIRAKGILVMRIMDGYRPRRYGTNSQDDDKVSMQFALRLELGTTLHYEFSYVASRFHNPLVGNAHVKVSISGEPTFVQMIKNEYIGQQFHSKRSRSMTLKEKAASRICQFLNWIKHEDIIESNICPLDWSKCLSQESQFLHHLSQLVESQLYRHFRCDQFELILTSEEVHVSMQSNQMTFNDLSDPLSDAIQSWSTLMIIKDKLYMRVLPSSEDGSLTNYCLIEKCSTDLPRLYKVNIYYFEQVETNVRIRCSRSLQATLESWNDMLIVLPEPISDKIVDSKKGSSKYLQNEETWELLSETELLSLIHKRRCFFDNFISLVLNVNSFILVKFINGRNKKYLVSYHLVMTPQNTFAKVFMDLERNVFSDLLLDSLNTDGKHYPLFKTICSDVKERDEKCARAIRSRRNLLSLFESQSSTGPITINFIEDVKRLLLYSTKSTITMRFFDEALLSANKILEDLTVNYMLTGSSVVDVAQIFVGAAQKVGHLETGKWFLIRYDSETLSMAHIPSSGKAVPYEDTFESTTTIFTRQVSFYTVAFADLYYYQSDTTNRSAQSDDIENSEHKLSRFISELETAHSHHFATAAYLALRQDPTLNGHQFMHSDFAEIMRNCIDEEFISYVEILAPNSVMKDQGSGSETLLKLENQFSNMILPIPGGEPYYFFSGDENLALKEIQTSLYGENITFEEKKQQQDDDDMYSMSTDSQSHNEDGKQGKCSYLKPPVFIMIFINDRPATLSDIHNIEDTAALNIAMTTFDHVAIKDSSIHEGVASVIRSLLNSFTAEQTLEQLLWECEAIDEVDLEVVKYCLLEAENVVSVTIPLQFYRPNTDTMVDATADAMKEGIESCFFLLGQCLRKQTSLNLIEDIDGDFFAIDIKTFGWCWIGVLEEGRVCVHVFHQAGIEKAEQIQREAMKIVDKECHHVNQILLLETMQKSRASSDLLLPPDHPNSKENDSQDRGTLMLPDGYFKCDVVHSAFYAVNPRCSPSKILVELQYSVLSSFAISNRLGYFVYKDEEENIFYMNFESSSEKEGTNNGIKFYVYGIYEATDSITSQLDRLIKRKIMSSCVDLISHELTKSQHFDLADTDVDFIKSFESDWNELGNTNNRVSEEEYYEFPSPCYDPVLVLLCFRQNISGSSFFNIWRKSSQISENIDTKNTQAKSPPNAKTVNIATTRSGTSFKFDHKDFLFIYNATQFQLNPQFQGISTLTAKGKEFSRKAGTGMALVEIKLLDNDLNIVKDTSVGKIPGHEIDALKLVDSLQMRRLHGGKSEKTRRDRYYMSVKIYNTTLDFEPIYRWIELTLNQALVSWITERHLELARLGQCRLHVNTLEDARSLESKVLHISRLSPGLTSLGGILAISEKLPHPAIKKVQVTWTAKSTDLSSLTLDCLERGILLPLYGSKKIDVSDVLGLRTIRVLNGSANEVKIKNVNPHGTTVTDENNIMMLDSPTTSPQYLIIYGLSFETEEIRRREIVERTQVKGAPPITSFLFQKVSIDDYLSDSVDGSLSSALKELCLEDPYIFMRRIAFIVTINRSGLHAYFYNVNPQTVENVNLRLEEIRVAIEKRNIDTIRTQNHRHPLHMASFSLSKKEGMTASNTQRAPRRLGSNLSHVSSIPEERPSNPASKDKKRNILIPTIVGKSIKGSAEQALLHSRQRARAGTKKIGSKTASQRGREQSIVKTSLKSSTNGQEKSQSSKQTNRDTPKTFLPPPIQRDLQNLQNFIYNRSLYPSNSFGLTQSMFLHWLVNSGGKELSFLAMGNVLNYATALNSRLFPLVPSTVLDPIPFLLYFVKNAFPEDSSNIVVAKNFVSNKNKFAGDLENPTIYVMQLLSSGQFFQSYIIHELSIKQIKAEKIGKCRSWMFSTSKASRDSKCWTKGSTVATVAPSKKKNLLMNREKEIAKIQRSAIYAVTYLQPDLKAFMFTLNILRGMAKGVRYPNISTAQLLHDSMIQYTEAVQEKTNIGHWYRLLSRSISWDKDLFNPQMFQKTLEYILENKKEYKIVDCTMNDICISAEVPCEFEDCDYFIHTAPSQIQNESISFTLYVLCSCRGQTLERYVLEEGYPVAIKLSEQLLNIAEEKFHDLCELGLDEMLCEC